jgi:glutamate--cysteine ligase
LAFKRNNLICKPHSGSLQGVRDDHTNVGHRRTSPRIAGKHELVEYLEAGCKPSEDWRIGTEHEKFGFLRENLAPLPYEGKASVLAMLEGLRDRFGWVPIVESGKLIGLQRDGASVSLEPGGQFELSGAPLETIHQTCRGRARTPEEVREIADPLGISASWDWAQARCGAGETPVMPKGRYKIMMEYMDKVGRLGREMMFRTCTVQVNPDFGSEADMVQKMRVALRCSRSVPRCLPILAIH